MAIKLTTGGRLAAAMMMAVGLSACSTGLPKSSEFERIADTPITDRSSDINRSAQEAVNFLSEPAVTVLETSGSNALRLTTEAGQKVPDVPVGEINAQPMEFGPLLNQVAEQVGMSWRITGANKGDLLSKEVYYVQRSETTLKTVLDELAELTNSFYKVEGDRIIFSQDRLFILRVPRMADSQEVLSSGLSNLGATDVFTDKLSGTISFRATQDAYKNARRLIESFESGRDMVVYDLWIIDRQISDNAGLGADVDFSGQVDGEDAGINLKGLGVIESIASGSAGGTFLSGNVGQISVDLTASFLRSLGKTQTVARPTISMLSGGDSEFKSGTTREYIREINSSTSEDGEESSSGTDVQKLETGVNVKVEGSHNNGVISSKFDIEVDEFIEFEEFDTGTVTLKLPRTTERKLTAHMEARPGDVMVLGGIIRNREEIGTNEVIGTNIPTARRRETEKTETILLVRPRLVQIRPTRIEAPKAPLRVENGVGSLDLKENPIEGVMQDEERARALLEQMSK
jgi:type II secretory pathway component GspD/PulD (secretin)